MNEKKQVLVIAEAGVNHNGNIDMAKRLVTAAAAAGADLVKFQTFKAASIASNTAKKAAYQVRNEGASGVESEDTQLEMLQRLELSESDHEALIAHCRKHSVEFFSTGFDLKSLEYLNSLGFHRFKVPSGEITNLPYLRLIGSYGRDVILSTGMASLGEIEMAIEVLEGEGLARDRITVLHCTTDYPAPIEDVNLRAMQSIGTAFGVAVGYSDHTEGVEVSIAAVALGARVIEKHFTLDRNLPGPDHAASLEPDELKAMICGIRKVEAAMGTPQKRLTPSEVANRDVARKSIVAARPIVKGELFSEKNLTTKRPGTGMSPMCWDEVLGRPAPSDFALDDEVTL